MQTPLLGVILALIGPAALQGSGIRPADLAGDWVLAFDLYGETNHQRMTVETTGDRITVAAWGLTQAAIAKRLGLTQPRLNDLLRGRITKFSLDALINVATAAGLVVRVEVVKAA